MPEMGNSITPMAHESKNCSNAYEMDGIRLGLCVFEMFINVCVIGASAPFAKMVASIRSFTGTMKVLFLNMLFAAFGIALTRLFILIPQYISINQLYSAALVAPVQIFHDVCINVNTLITMAITIEFFVYSLWPNPKQSTTILFSIINTFWPWSVTIGLYCFEKNDVIETVPEFVVLLVINLLSWAVFLRLFFHNRKRYKTMFASSLDEKYQITVKIRVLRTFLFLAALTTARNFLTMTLLIVIIKYVVPECLYYVHLYCNHTYDISVALYSLLFIVPLALTHSEFRKQLRKFVFGSASSPSVLPHITISTERQEQQIRNALGENLIVRNTANIYYSQLAHSWNQRPAAVVNPTAKNNLLKAQQSLKLKALFARKKGALSYKRKSMATVEIPLTSHSSRRNTSTPLPQFARTARLSISTF